MKVNPVLIRVHSWLICKKQVKKSRKRRKFVANLKKQACPEQRRMEPKPAFGRKSEARSSKSETKGIGAQ
jgi:hypothetical protein